jgi:hypothetical protein
VVPHLKAFKNFVNKLFFIEKRGVGADPYYNTYEFEKDKNK